jgi:outer membrane receptor protein involved in Fe transport
VLYGDTSTAGSVNLVSKRPQAEAFNEIGVQFGSFNRKQVQMDSTGKLTKDGEWLYRFVGVFRDSGIADRLRSGQPHRAGAVADLAADQQHQLDRARHLSEGQYRLVYRIPAA